MVLNDSEPIVDAGHHPTLVVSLPKCGTYLMAELLKGLGCRWTGMHLAENGYSNYLGADIQEARQNPGQFARNEPLSQSLTRVQRGDFAVGHLSFNAETLSATARFKRIYLTRDLRLALISYMRFLQTTGRLGAEQLAWYSIPDPRKRLLVFLMTSAPYLLKRFYAGLDGWSQVDGILHVRFEELTGDVKQARSVVESVASLLGVKNANAGCILQSSLAAATITKSEGLTRLSDYWSAAAEKQFIAIGGAELNARLGSCPHASDCMSPRGTRHERKAV